MFSITAVAGNGVTVEPSGVTKVKKGESKTFTVTIQDGYTFKSATLDGVDIAVVNNTITVSGVLADKNLKVEAISNDVLLLTKAPWYLKSIEYYENNDFSYSLNLQETPERLTDKYYYYQNGTWEMISALGISFGLGKWSINGKVMTIGPVRTYEIKELTEKSFSNMTFLETLPNGKAKYQKLIYFRP